MLRSLLGPDARRLRKPRLRQDQHDGAVAVHDGCVEQPGGHATLPHHADVDAARDVGTVRLAGGLLGTGSVVKKGGRRILVVLSPRPDVTKVLRVEVAGSVAGTSGKKLFGDPKKGEGSAFVLVQKPADLPKPGGLYQWRLP